jgi:hypothetical protein
LGKFGRRLWRLNILFYKKGKFFFLTNLDMRKFEAKFILIIPLRASLLCQQAELRYIGRT